MVRGLRVLDRAPRTRGSRTSPPSARPVRRRRSPPTRGGPAPAGGRRTGRRGRRLLRTGCHRTAKGWHVVLRGPMVPAHHAHLRTPPIICRPAVCYASPCGRAGSLSTGRSSCALPCLLHVFLLSMRSPRSACRHAGGPGPRRAVRLRRRIPMSEPWTRVSRPNFIVSKGTQERSA